MRITLKFSKTSAEDGSVFKWGMFLLNSNIFLFFEVLLLFYRNTDSVLQCVAKVVEFDPLRINCLGN